VSAPEFDTEAYLDAAAAWFGFDLSPQSREAVKTNLGLLRAHAANFMDVELDPHLDPATVLAL
jgi:hypothetical protein